MVCAVLVLQRHGILVCCSTQVFASLLVSVLLIGIKLTAAQQLVQITERRKELQANLSALRMTLEHQDTIDWIDDVMHDAKEREDRIAELESTEAFSTAENATIEKCMGAFKLFNGRDAGTTHLKHSPTITRLETKLEEAGRLLLGQAVAQYRADPREIVAFFLSLDSRFMKSLDAANPNLVRFESLERVNGHHTIAFGRYSGPGVDDRTFLMSVIAKQLTEEPLSYAVAVIPIPRHDKIGLKDEARAVRAEVYRSYRLTESSPGVTTVEYSCSIDLKGFVPQIITNTISVPQQLEIVGTHQRYFQQVRPLAKCDADDGRFVAHMLIELVEGNPKDLGWTIRTFVNRTTMLRECGFGHIGVMLVHLLSTDAHKLGHNMPDDDAAIVAHVPSLVTEKQAAAIGDSIASSVRVHRSNLNVPNVHNILMLHAVLQAMKSSYTWFVPMLEVLTTRKAAKPRRSFVKRFSSIVVAEVPVPIVTRSDALSSAHEADEVTTFSGVVLLPPLLLALLCNQ
jgi:hypothetical protein